MGFIGANGKGLWLLGSRLGEFRAYGEVGFEIQGFGFRNRERGNRSRHMTVSRKQACKKACIF